MSKEVIAIYDVRGIQDYIFRTNVLKEIVGASFTVANLIIDEFEDAVKNSNLSENEYILDWEKASTLKFEKDENIKIEVLYYGGGNLVVLFRNSELCEDISIRMSKNIIKKAHGLSLVYSYVEKTEDYQEDWKNLKDALAKVKATTPLTKPVGVIPIVTYDNVTGLPLSKVIEDNGRTKRVTMEAFQKLKKYKSDNSDSRFVKELDRMRTSDEEGLISIVHIDGNSMGINIGNIMRSAKNYEDAASRMRKISSDIHRIFEIEALNYVVEKLPEICEKHGLKTKPNELPFRPLIMAGDDITFVCNARIGLDITKEYIDAIRKGYMYDKEYPFSACAGISIIHSHFPFYMGYQIAEACCASAKKRAKSEEYQIDKKIGNFVDFHYSYSGLFTGDLDAVRDKNYVNVENKSLTRRPYGIFNEEETEKLNDKQKECDIDKFIKDIDTVSKISRSTAKEIRDTYYQSEADLVTLIKRKHLKDENFPIELKPYYNDGVAKYYDALEFFDLYATKEVK